MLLRGTARQHRTGPSWASNDDPLKDLSNTRALKSPFVPFRQASERAGGRPARVFGARSHHTCHRDFENCKFLHTGVTKDPRGVGQEDEGGAGGSRTSVVFVERWLGSER